MEFWYVVRDRFRKKLPLKYSSVDEEEDTLHICGCCSEKEDVKRLSEGYRTSGGIKCENNGPSSQEYKTMSVHQKIAQYIRSGDIGYFLVCFEICIFQPIYL